MTTHDVDVAHPEFLAAMFALGAVTCLAAAAVVARAAPAVAFGLVGAIIGGLAGFLIGSSDGPAEVPAYMSVGASIGLVVFALAALIRTSPRPPPPGPLRVGAALLAIATPIATAGLVALLQLACPLYVSGPDAGFCDYQQYDLLGGWVSGVAVAFAFDALFTALVLLVSARRADRALKSREDPSVGGGAQRVPWWR